MENNLDNIKVNEKTNKYICPYCSKEYTKMGISTHIWRSHGEGKNFTANNDGFKNGTRESWNKGLTKEDNPNLFRIKIPTEEILEGKHPQFSTYKLKMRLFKEKILEEKCSECGIGSEWNGKLLSLQLDHKNGINDDHRLENLVVLCPNCHSQTETYAGKNKKGKTYKN